jgi:predicted nuclease of predicted toxin-antitoxin system
LKLLFDQNLSPALVERLADLFPESTHLYFFDFDRADDLEVWAWAKKEGFAIVTKDADFADLDAMIGGPPFVVWLRVGNCSTDRAESLLRDNHAIIERFVENHESGVIALS